MDATKNYLINTYRHFMHDSLYRNSIFLMLDTVILASFGFIFWAIAARFYSVHDIGITVTIISAASLITILSALGFDSTLVRLLTKTKNMNGLINTALTVTGIMGLVISIGYLIVVSHYSNSLHFLNSSFVMYSLFIAFMVINLWNNITNNIFVAFRKTHYIALINLSFSILRIVLLISLITLGLNGILISQFAGIALSLLLTFVVLKHVINYHFRPSIDISVLKESRIFASGSYISNTLSNAPNFLLPTVLLVTLGPKFAAYYYIVSMLANTLNIIPFATSQSLFAEGSHDTDNLKFYTLKSIKFVTATVIPSIIIMIVVGSYILNIYGHTYTQNGYSLLILIAASILPRSANYILSSVFRIRHRLRQLSYIYTFYAFVVVAGSYITLQNKFSIVYLGLIIIIAELITTAYLSTFMFKSHLLETTYK